jgi:hypothetical protein
MRRTISTSIKGAYFSFTGNGLMVITNYTCLYSSEIILLTAALLKNILIV